MRGYLFLARLKGLEPPTYWFVASHSIQLSYKRIFGFAVSIQPIYNIIVFIEMQEVNCKFFVTARKSHTAPSAKKTDGATFSDSDNKLFFLTA